MRASRNQSRPPCFTRLLVERRNKALQQVGLSRASGARSEGSQQQAVGEGVFDIADLRKNIFRYLNPCETVGASLVCKQWKDDADDDKLWEQHFQGHRWASLPGPLPGVEVPTLWKVKFGQRMLAQRAEVKRLARALKEQENRVRASNMATAFQATSVASLGGAVPGSYHRGCLAPCLSEKDYVAKKILEENLAAVGKMLQSPNKLQARLTKMKRSLSQFFSKPSEDASEKLLAPCTPQIAAVPLQDKERCTTKNEVNS